LREGAPIGYQPRPEATFPEMQVKFVREYWNDVFEPLVQARLPLA